MDNDVFLHMLVLSQAGIAIGLTCVLLLTALRARQRVHITMLAFSYLVLTLLNLEASDRGDFVDLRLALSVAAWVVGDIGMVFALINRQKCPGKEAE